MTQQKFAVNHHRGMTLIELLVVISIIGVLTAILLPAVQAAREAARRTHCANNMRQIGLGLHNYHDAFRTLPAGWTGDAPLGEPGWGWASTILPFTEQNHVSNRINYNLPVEAEENELARKMIIPFFLCPDDDGELVGKLGHLELDEDGHRHGNPASFLHDPPGEHGHTDVIDASRCNYSGVFGTFEIEDDPANGNGTFFFHRAMTFADIKDGLSNTAVVGERSSKFGEVLSWVGVFPECDEPMARHLGSADHPPNDPHNHFEDFGSYHPAGAHFLMADGSVQLINEDVHIEIYKAMATRAGCEPFQRE